MAWNLAVFWAINHLAAHAAWTHGIVGAFALWGGPVLLVVILAIAWWRHRSRPTAVADSSAAVLTGVAAVVALGINQVAAMLWFEPRPFVSLHGVTVLLSHSSDDSFPSDHAAIAGALAVGVLLFARRWGLVAIVVAVLAAVSRVYAGMHYPLDVIAGLAIGAVSALLVVGLLTRPVAALAERHLPRRLLAQVGPDSDAERSSTLV
jgi:membrane-associated phospholipid phosphatase